MSRSSTWAAAARIALGMQALAFVLILASCSNGTEQASAQTAAPARGNGPGQGAPGGRGGGGSTVTVGTVLEQPMGINVHAVGNVEASSTVEVRSQVTGEMLTVEFTEGQEVKAGDLLFTLDSRPFEVALRQAEAVLAKDTGQSKTAETTRTRYANLLKSGLISQADFDAVSAQANSLQSSIAADNANIDNVKLQLQYTKIHAPVGGRTGALLVHKGSLVRPNDTSPLVVINQIAPVFVTFAVPARLLPQIQSEKARGRLQTSAAIAGTSQASTGVVTFIDNTVDQASDTIRLKATFQNADRRLWPGQFAEVTLQLAVDPHAIVVPSSAVQPSQQGTFVYVVKADRTVEARPVTVARTDGDNSIIGTGLHAGETIVTDGQLGLTPGARVTIRNAAPAKQGQ